MSLVEEAQKAARLLHEHAYVRILARAGDADAACAAALLAHAMRREGIDFHVTWTARLDAPAAHMLSEEKNDALVLLGLGGDASEREPMAGRKLIVDHDAQPLPGEAVLHDDASLASLSSMVAVALSPRNLDLAPLALAGAVAARRHILGWSGLDARILAEATASGVVQNTQALNLRGGTLLAALSALDAPCVSGLTGRARNAKKLVTDLQLTGEAPPQSLPDADAERLGSHLTLRLLQQGASDAALDALFRPKLATLKGPHTGYDAAELALLSETAAALGRSGLALAALWPDEAARGELSQLADTLRDDLVAALLKAERELRHEGPTLAWADATNAGLCAPLADRIALALVPERHLVLVRAPGAQPEHVQVALRSFAPAHDISILTRTAAASCGGWAAGTRREARATVPLVEEERFRKLMAEGYA